MHLSCGAARIWTRDNLSASKADALSLGISYGHLHIIFSTTYLPYTFDSRTPVCAQVTSDVRLMYLNFTIVRCWAWLCATPVPVLYMIKLLQVVDFFSDALYDQDGTVDLRHCNVEFKFEFMQFVSENTCWYRLKMFTLLLINSVNKPIQEH